MPIPNGTPSTAITISSLPFSVTLDPETEFTGGWYKYTPLQDEVLGIYGCNALERDVDVDMYLGNDPLSLTLQFTEGAKRPRIWPIAVGTDVYFQLYTNWYVSGDTMTLTVETPTNTAIQAGDLLITEDEGHAQLNLYDPSFQGFWPSTWYAPDGTLRYVDATFPSSELGACLANGIWGFISRSDDKFYIYAAVPGISQIGAFAMPFADSAYIKSLATDFEFWYILYAPNGTDPLEVYKVTDAGVITGPIATTQYYSACTVQGGGGNASSGMSRDGTILYYPNNVVGGGIYRHNISTDIELSEFAAPDPLDFIGDVIVLSDGTVVATYSNDAGTSNSVDKVVQYSAAGAVLQSWEVDAFPWTVHHLCWTGNDLATELWVWTQWLGGSSSAPPNISGYNRYRQLKLSDGTYTQDFTASIFTLGKGGYDDSDSCGSAFFGAPHCCPLMVMMGAASPEPPPDPDPEPPDVFDGCPGGGMLLPAGSGGDGCTSC